MKHDLAYYRAIQGMTGVSSAKEAELRAIRHDVSNDFANSLDCEKVQVNGEDSALLITKTVDRTIKNIVTRPDDNIHLGDIVRWSNDDWIVDVIDSDDRTGTRGKMRRCNVVLRWLDDYGVIHAYPGFCEDATKYGEGVINGKMLQTPDFQIKAKIHLDGNSVRIPRGKRFLLDASQYLLDIADAGENADAFIVTRRNVLTGAHRGHGYAEFTLVECAHSEYDNDNLMIANYYDPSDVYTLTIDNAESNLSLAVGATYALTCTATKNGDQINQTSIQFKSSDEDVAAIDAEGVIAAHSLGLATIAASVGSIKRTVELEVVESAEDYIIYIEPDDGYFEIPFGTSKNVQCSIYNGNTPLPYLLDFEIAVNPELVTLDRVDDNSIRLIASDSAADIGKSFVLRVMEVGRATSKDATFTIRGWW